MGIGFAEGAYFRLLLQCEAQTNAVDLLVCVALGVDMVCLNRVHFSRIRLAFTLPSRLTVSSQHEQLASALH